MVVFGISGRVEVECHGTGGAFTAIEPARHHRIVGRVPLSGSRKGGAGDKLTVGGTLFTVGHTCTSVGAPRNCGADEARV